jgi:hypothetical protein
MLLPLTLGCLHALEPDHVAVVTGASLNRPRGAWKVGLTFGVSHMLAVALIALLGAGLGRTVLGDGLFVWLDRLAWAFVALLGLWNLAAALGLRRLEVHAHPHAHLAIEHEHPHGAGEGHRFHHGLAWLGAFFGLGGFRGFMTLASRAGAWDFVTALLLFGLGITAVFILLSWASGLLAARFGEAPGLRRALYGVSGAGNLAVGLWLLARP